jgi:hypothetical protein
MSRATDLHCEETAHRIDLISGLVREWNLRKSISTCSKVAQVKISQRREGGFDEEQARREKQHSSQMLIAACLDDPEFFVNPSYLVINPSQLGGAKASHCRAL